MALLSNDTPKRARLRWLDIILRGAAGAGNEPAKGAGGDEGLIIRVPSTQTAAIARFQSQAASAAATDLWVVNADGSLSLSGVPTSKIYVSKVNVSAANVTDTAAGHFGNAAGVVLAADPGAGKVCRLINAVMYFKYATAQYTGGGNITININGGAAVTGLIAAAGSVGGGADAILQFVPLAATATALTANKGLNLVAASAFTQPGTAAGTIEVFTTYQVDTL